MGPSIYSCEHIVRLIDPFIPARTNSISKWTKILSLDIDIFGLKMMVKSGLEFFILKFSKPLTPWDLLKKDLNDVTAALFSVSFPQLATATKHWKWGSCDIIRVLLISWRLKNFISQSRSEQLWWQNTIAHRFFKLSINKKVSLKP